MDQRRQSQAPAAGDLKGGSADSGIQPALCPETTGHPADPENGLGFQNAPAAKDPLGEVADTYDNEVAASNLVAAAPRVEAPGTDAAQAALEPLPPLVTGAMRGDADATRTLLVGIGKQVRGACRAILGSGHPDLEDTVQECFVGLIRALPAYRFEGAFSHYALRIAVRTALAARRQARATQVRSDLSEAPGADLPADGVTPAEQVLVMERREALRQLVAGLPEAQAQALVMRILFDLSIEEIAAASGVSVNTVKTRLRLAKDALRRRIGEDQKLLSVLGGHP